MPHLLRQSAHLSRRPFGTICMRRRLASYFTREGKLRARRTGALIHGEYSAREGEDNHRARSDSFISVNVLPRAAAPARNKKGAPRDSPLRRCLRRHPRRPFRFAYDRHFAGHNLNFVPLFCHSSWSRRGYAARNRRRAASALRHPLFLFSYSPPACAASSLPPS